RNFAHQSCKSRRKLRYRHGTEHLRPAVSRKTAALSGEHQRTEYLVWWYAHTHTHTRTHTHTHTHTHAQPPNIKFPVHLAHLQEYVGNIVSLFVPQKHSNVSLDVVQPTRSVIHL